MAVFAVRFTAAWGLPVTDGSAHVENLVPVYPNRVLDTVCVRVSFPSPCSLISFNCVSSIEFIWRRQTGEKRQSLMLIISQFYIYCSLITLWCWKSHLKICSSDVSLVQLLVFITECGLQQFCKLLFSCCSSVGCPGVSERYFQLSAWVQSLTLPAIVSSRTAGTTCWESQRQQDIAGILFSLSEP